jgi:hypothetical protein
VWLDVVIIGCSSLSAAVSADGILLGFSCYLVLLILYWAAVPGWTFNEFHTCSNTCPLCVTLEHLLNYLLYDY